MIRQVSPFVVIALLFAVLAASVSMAQDSSTGVPVQFAGRIATVEGTTLTVNQLRIEVRAAQVNAPLQPDSLVVIRGVLLDSGVITAQAISIYVPPTPTPLSTQQTEPTQPLTPVPTLPLMTQAPPSAFAVEGPVQAIENGVVWVNNMPFQYDPDDSLFADLLVGDVLRLEGSIVQVGDETTLEITAVSVVSGASDANPAPTATDETAMGMGMGMGVGR